MAIDSEDVRVGSLALREHIDDAGYGSFISNDYIRQIVEVILQAQDDRRSGVVI